MATSPFSIPRRSGYTTPRSPNPSRATRPTDLNPARIFALEGLGTLSPGSHGDVTIFDPAQKWIYDASQSKSKSRNTPYGGWSFTGKIIATIVAGKIVYQS